MLNRDLFNQEPFPTLNDLFASLDIGVGARELRSKNYNSKPALQPHRVLFLFKHIEKIRVPIICALNSTDGELKPKAFEFVLNYAKFCGYNEREAYSIARNRGAVNALLLVNTLPEKDNLFIQLLQKYRHSKKEIVEEGKHLIAPDSELQAEINQMDNKGNYSVTQYKADIETKLATLKNSKERLANHRHITDTYLDLNILLKKPTDYSIPEQEIKNYIPIPEDEIKKYIEKFLSTPPEPEDDESTSIVKPAFIPEVEKENRIAAGILVGLIVGGIVAATVIAAIFSYGAALPVAIPVAASLITSVAAAFGFSIGASAAITVATGLIAAASTYVIMKASSAIGAGIGWLRDKFSKNKSEKEENTSDKKINLTHTVVGKATGVSGNNQKVEDNKAKTQENTATEAKTTTTTPPQNVPPSTRPPAQSAPSMSPPPGSSPNRK